MVNIVPSIKLILNNASLFIIICNNGKSPIIVYEYVRACTYVQVFNPTEEELIRVVEGDAETETTHEVGINKSISHL